LARVCIPKGFAPSAAGRDVPRPETQQADAASYLQLITSDRPATVKPLQNPACHLARRWYCVRPFMKENIHPKYVDSEIRCACGNVIKTRSTKPVVIVGICNVCHPFYTGQQKFVDTAGRVDKFQQRMAKTQAAQAAAAASKKKKR
jgi:large subunit ribosomal protein L31